MHKKNTEVFENRKSLSKETMNEMKLFHTYNYFGSDRGPIGDTTNKLQL